MNRRLFAAAAGTAALGAGGLLLSGGQDRSAAPDVNFILLDGSVVTTAQLKGQVALVSFWATSCTVCVAEMPHLVQSHRKFASRGYSTLAVAMSYDPPAYVAKFAETRKLPFGVVIDNTGLIANSFGEVRLTPTAFLIDKRGRIVKRYVGVPDFAALDRLIGQLLAEA